MGDAPAKPNTVRRTPARRLSGFALLLALVAVGGLWAANQPWWRFDLPAQTPVTNDLRQLDPIQASQEVSAVDIVNFTAPAPAPELTREQMALPDQRPSSMFGLPTAVVLLAAAAVFALAGAAVKLTAVSFLSLACMPFAWSANAELVSYVENPLGGGDFVTSLTAVELFNILLMVGFGLAAVSTLQVFMLNATARAKERAAARAAGTETPTLLTLLWTQMSSTLARFAPADTSRPPQGQ